MIEKTEKILNNFKFIDLFAGIGGFHIALSSFGAKCVFASEIDKYAAETYKENFDIEPYGDITKINENDIPKHDILCAGFPCQAFSISGKQKGFEDSRGTLFFDVARIANSHRPKVLFLENVKNLAQHDEGRTLSIILRTLDNLNYTTNIKVLNASNFGLAQNRERIYIVAFRKDIDSKNFNFPLPTNQCIALEQFLEEETKNAKVIERKDINIYKDIENSESLFGSTFFNRPMQIGIVNKGGQGERIYHPKGHAITLSANGGGVGAKTGLYKIDGKIRKLSPRECARLQGYPDTFKINKLMTQSYKQFGNSVPINVLQYITREIARILLNKKNNTKNKQMNEVIYG